MYCNNCGQEMVGSSKFCSNCGNKINTDPTIFSGKQLVKNKFSRIRKTQTNFRELAPEDNTMNNKQDRKYRIYHGKAGMINEAADKIESVFITEKLETQLISIESGTIVQGRKKQSLFRSALGLETAATIRLECSGTDLTVRMDAAKWNDKTIGTVVGVAVFWPALLTTAWGIYMQHKLFKLLDNELISLLT